MPRASWKRLPSSSARRSGSGAVRPWPGLLLESRGRDEIAQLDELRLTALMDRIDCDLALGRHEQVLGELSLLVREHPLRERLRAQQMLALYRADRQAEALDAYAEARRTLVDDLGIEPSEALQRLQQAILRHDPSLETPDGHRSSQRSAGRARLCRPTGRPTGVEERAPRRRFRPRRWQLALAAVAIIAAAAAAAVTSPPRLRRHRTSSRTASSGSTRSSGKIVSVDSGRSRAGSDRRSPRARSGRPTSALVPSPATTCAPTACETKGGFPDPALRHRRRHTMATSGSP